MIMVTGGLGFIGSHTTRALLDLGEPCVLVQRRASGGSPEFVGEAIVERADIIDLPSLLDIGTRHKITGIVHLAGSVPWPPGAHEPLDGARKAITSLLNVLQAARDWGVRRVGVASTIGVYGGVDAAASPLGEDLPLPMVSGHVIPAFKKIGELLTDHLGGATGVEIVNYRIAAIWGPLGRAASPFFAAPQLVHAAAHGTTPDLTALRGPAYAEDTGDLCYARDCGRAIALLQVADRLDHRTYNVASGRATSNAEIIAAIRRVVPDARVDLPTGGTSEPLYLDITRLRQDTGYQPEYDTERAVADYLTWLRR
jgi:UDP-glucose 4-epimerase